MLIIQVFSYCSEGYAGLVYERMKPAKIQSDEYELFLENDSDLAMAYGNDIALLKRNKAELR